MEVYVDNMIVKSKESTDHTKDLQETFDRLKSYNMHPNPQKCTFGVAVRKFLEYLVT